MQREYLNFFPFFKMRENNKILRECYEDHFIKKFKLELNRPYLRVPIYIYIYKYSQKQPPEAFYKKAVLESFAIFTRNHQCWSFFLIKASNFFKKRLQHRCFPVNIAQFLRTPTLKNVCDQLLLYSQLKNLINWSYSSEVFCKEAVLKIIFKAQRKMPKMELSF